MNTQSAPTEVRVKREDQQPKLVTFGRGGHTIHFNRNCHQTGYDKPETWFEPSQWWAHDYSEKRDTAQYEGVPFIDKRAAVETDTGFKFVISGPMVNVDLAEGEIDACPEPSTLMASAMMSDPGNQFGSLLALQAVSKACKSKAGPLDGVSTAEYMRLWKENGATIGTIRDGQFIAE